MKFIIAFIAFISTACTTTKYVVKEIDTSIEVKGQVGDQKLGLNDKGQAILQEEVYANQELLAARGGNAMLQDDLDREYSALETCREHLADPEIGGTGEVREIPEVDNLAEPRMIREEFGLDGEGELKFVKRELFEEAIKREKRYRETLLTMIKVTKKHNRMCQRDLRYARTKAGKPASTIQPGHFTEDGTWVADK